MLLKDYLQALDLLNGTFREFCSQFDSKIPEDFFTPSITFNFCNTVDGDIKDQSKFHLVCHLNYVTDQDRDRALTLMGDLFGRHGWTASQTNSSYERPRLDWTKEVMGIPITIYGAKFLPKQPDEIPVMPSEFPVLLRDRPDSDAQPPAQNS